MAIRREVIPRKDIKMMTHLESYAFKVDISDYLMGKVFNFKRFSAIDYGLFGRRRKKKKSTPEIIEGQTEKKEEALSEEEDDFPTEYKYTPALENILKTFDNKKIILFFSWLRRMHRFLGEADLFLMAAPATGQPLKSDKNHLYLYKNDNGSFSYYIEATSYTLEAKELSEKLGTASFTQKKENPVKCEDPEIGSSVFGITSKRGHSCLSRENVQHTIFTLARPDELKKQDLQEASEAGLISIELDVTDWTKADFDRFAGKIRFHDALPIFKLHLKGVPRLEKEELSACLAPLSVIEFIEVEEDNFPLTQKMATEAVYERRLLEELDCKLESVNPWGGAIKKWVDLPNIDEHNRRVLPYLKNNISHKRDAYTAYLEGLYCKSKEKATPRYWLEGRVYEHVTLINFYIAQLGSSFFRKMIDNLRKNPEQVQGTVLDLNHLLDEESIDVLAESIAQFPFLELRIKVTKELLETKAFLKLLEALNESHSLQKLSLDFGWKELESNVNEINKILRDKALGRAEYFIEICGAHRPSLSSFEQDLIGKIQEKNQRKLQATYSQQQDEKKLSTEVKESKRVKTGLPRGARKEGITLKSVREQKNSQGTAVGSYSIPVYVNHVAIGQQVHLQAQALELLEEKHVHQIETNLNQQLQNCQIYEGELIDAHSFRSWEEKYPYSRIFNGVMKAAFEMYSSKDFYALQDRFYNGLRQQCFAKIPHSIQYYTKACAVEMAKNLPALVAMNLGNLPQHFLLKKTKTGALVLDYDPYYINTHVNVFTPKIWSRQEASEPIYCQNLVRVKKETLQKWMQNEPLYKAIFLSHGPYGGLGALEFDDSKIANLWFKFGDVGVKLFLQKLSASSTADPEFPLFLYNHYLKNFFHWDHLIDEGFLTCLDQVIKYEPLKLSCLKQFLTGKGCSKYNFSDALRAFEYFWSRLDVLCKTKGANINLIASSWRSPPYGNPIVYMERLLRILENAHDLKEQLACLNHLDLAMVYDDFYASENEGFKIVHPKMELSYQRQKTAPFNPDLHLYRVELHELHQDTLGVATADLESFTAQEEKRKESTDDFEEKESQNDEAGENEKPSQLWLVKEQKEEILPLAELSQLIAKRQAVPYSEEKFTPEYKLYFRDEEEKCLSLEGSTKQPPLSEFLVRVYRFLGQQTQGISIQAYSEAVEKYISNNITSVHAGSFPPIIFTTLLLVTHPRYKKEVSVTELLDILGRIQRGSNKIIHFINHCLLALYKKDIRLSDVEAALIFERIRMMNSCEYERAYGFGFSEKNKIKHLEKLFHHLEKNKYGTLKLIEQLGHAQKKRPFVYALDTADQLATADPVIAEVFCDDLLLFSELINGGPLYHKGRRNKDFLACIQRVKDQLHTAATLFQPNNLHYAFKLLVQSRKYFTWQQCADTLEEVADLQTFSPLKVIELLGQRGFTISDDVAMIISHDSSDVKSILIKLIVKINEYRRLPVEGQKSLFERLRSGMGPQPLDAEEKSLPEVTGEWSSSGASLESEETGLLDEEKLSALSLPDLDKTFQSELSQVKGMAGFAIRLMIKPLLGTLKNALIDGEFASFDTGRFAQLFCEKIKKLKDFQKSDDFEGLNFTVKHAGTLAQLLKLVLSRRNFTQAEEKFVQLFQRLDFSKLVYEQIFSLLDLLSKMPQRDYFEIVEALFLPEHPFLQDQKRFKEILGYIETLHSKRFNSGHLVKIIYLFSQAVKEDSSHFPLLLKKIMTAFDRDPNDPLLQFILDRGANLAMEQVELLLSVTESMADAQRLAVTHLLNALVREGDSAVKNFIATLATSSSQSRVTLGPAPEMKEMKDATSAQEKRLEDHAKILAIIAKTYNSSTVKRRNEEKIDYSDFVKRLSSLSPAELGELYQFFQGSTASAKCLYDALGRYSPTIPMAEFIATFERDPFGDRPAEFDDLSSVERIVNESMDLLNGSPYRLDYRKQLMEAFHFVHASSSSLPLYRSEKGEFLAAKNLSNKEIRDLFHMVKEGKLNHLTKFNQGLFALGLIREAMYRRTGLYAYPAQMIALIIPMMHEGHVISGIDGGQGKGLVDAMRASLLWLMSDCVNMTTYSHGDALRDTYYYDSFFSLLDIPHSDHFIRATSPTTSYQPNGINISTFPKLSLFLMKQAANGVDLGRKEGDLLKTSLVACEADQSILDETSVYRLASGEAPGLLSFGEEWVYDAINDFVATDVNFINRNRARLVDISYGELAAVREHLGREARRQQKSMGVISRKLSDDEYLLKLIESAVLVNYVLREKVDYLIHPEPEARQINGKSQVTHRIGIIDKNTKEVAGSTTTYGNGMQPLLYSHLNQQEKTKGMFVIEPDDKTTVSLCNINLLRFHEAQGGLIWGSTASPGSKAEQEWQHKKFNFEFSEIARSYDKRVTTHKPRFCADEKEQFKEIKQTVDRLKEEYKATVTLIFCKDIETTERLQNFFRERGENQVQAYIGLGSKAEYIAEAAKPGMVTLATNGLGRNADILYDYSRGMKVILSNIELQRTDKQKELRTGRQDSPGEVFYILNQQELGNQSIAQVRENLDKQARNLREFNHDLFETLGFFFACLRGLPDKAFAKGKIEFIRQDWSTWIEQIETEYRTRRLSDDYHRDQFIAKTTHRFQNLLIDGGRKNNINPEDGVKKKDEGEQKSFEPQLELDEALQKQLEALQEEKVIAHLTAAHPQPLPYKPHTERWITRADCIPPELIAYSFLEGTGKKQAEIKESLPERETRKQRERQAKQDIRRELGDIFALIEQGQQGDLPRRQYRYLSYLNQSPDRLNVVREAHQEFLADFLDKKIKTMRNAGFFARWFGFNKPLSRIADNRYYILFFTAMTRIPGEGNQANPAELKQVVLALLDEYLGNSWFISLTKRKEFKALKAKIASAEPKTVEELMKPLCDAKRRLFKSDVEENRKYWFKPVNQKGSRAQNSLDSTLLLLSALSGQPLGTDDTKNIADEFTAPLENIPADGDNSLDQFRKERSADGFLNMARFFNNRPTTRNRQAPVLDEANAQVALTSLDRIVKIAAPSIIPKNSRLFSSYRNEKKMDSPQPFLVEDPTP